MSAGRTTISGLLPAERGESAFSDFKPALTEAEAIAEASRCINCYAAPCTRACPTRIDIPRFISRIANGHVHGAARTILDSNILGLSCAQSCPTEVLCEGACVYNDLDHKPISIGKLQRYAIEKAYADGKTFYEPGPATGKRVALVGAGPASLACAHELRKLGHEAVIYEKATLPGGLNTTGIAPYKMKADVSLREIERVLAMGVRIEYGRELGRNLDLADMVGSHDAVFLGLGLGPDGRLDIPGSEHPSVQGAVDFIRRLKTSSREETERALRDVRTALVVGGGNTALDACRELRKLGVPRVIVSYRRDEESMSGYRHELRWARQEGVELLCHSVPIAFEPASESAVQVSLRVAIPGQDAETLTLRAGLVLLAIGQAKLERLLAETRVPGLAFEQGRLVVDPETGRTGHPKIFAGGDLANGGKEVVNAVAEGKRAALAIHRLLAEASRHG